MQSPAATARPLTSSPPVVMAPRADGVEVVWSVTAPSLGHVQIAEEDGTIRTVAEDRYGFVPQGEAVLRVLRERCDAGAAGLLVTHEARHAAWADRVVFLRDGVVVDTTGAPPAAETLLDPPSAV